MRHISQDTEKNAQFEYETLPAQQRASIQKLTIEIKENLRKTVQTIWEIGKKLVEVRSQLELCQFSSWLQAEFEWSRRTAYNFINVYEAFPEFSRANFARLDISISALYLLAAPSTPPQTRHHFIDRAVAGEHISHKIIQSAIKEVKVEQTNNNKFIGSVMLDADEVSKAISQIEPQPPKIDRDPNLGWEALRLESTSIAGHLPSTESAMTTASDLRPAWNLIEKEFSLFWGNTTSPHFIERLPEDALILAIPSTQWHHDWLLSKRQSTIILVQPMLRKGFVESVLSAFAQEDKALIFPWLPDWRTIEIALNLNIKVYAGDPELDRCEQTIAKLGLNSARTSWYQQ
jgi:Protein of unknown function (DUF3102)